MGRPKYLFYIAAIPQVELKAPVDLFADIFVSNPNTVELSVMILTERDSGNTFTIELGSILTVRLKENPTTGYRWAVTPARGFEQIGDRFESTGSGVGAGGTRVFQFRPTRVGVHRLHLRNWREWEGEASVVNRFEAEIIVK